MARYEHLPIYKKAMDLAICLEKVVRNFSRYHKYTLGSELREKSREVAAAKASWCRAASACLCFAFTAVTNDSGAADTIYMFHDERGVAHFSNVPADPRYRLFLRATTQPTPDAILASREVIVFAPPMVERGGEFSVTILLAGGAGVRGWLEFSFDPTVLTLVGATSHHDAPAHGWVRLEVPGGASTSFSADLHFLAGSSASDATSISLTDASLVSAKGELVVASISSPAVVAVSSLAIRGATHNTRERPRAAAFGQ